MSSEILIILRQTFLDVADKVYGSSVSSHLSLWHPHGPFLYLFSQLEIRSCCPLYCHFSIPPFHFLFRNSFPPGLSFPPFCGLRFVLSLFLSPGLSLCAPEILVLSALVFLLHGYPECLWPPRGGAGALLGHLFYPVHHAGLGHPWHHGHLEKSPARSHRPAHHGCCLSHAFRGSLKTGRKLSEQEIKKAVNG